MLVSIITPALNSEKTIEDTLKSVKAQTYHAIEHVVVDNDSVDNTFSIAKKYSASVITEDKKGIYYAMNKGLGFAKGEIIGFLNSDDVYANKDVIKKVVQGIEDSCYGDLVYTKRANSNHIRRYWQAGDARNYKLGWMPPHPTFFVKKNIYEKYGFYDTRFKIAGDYELMLRFLYKYKIKVFYIPEILVKMKLGGESNKNLINIFKKTLEDYKICKLYGFNLNTLFKKNIRKISQF